jgi:hypothetical protein
MPQKSYEILIHDSVTISKSYSYKMYGIHPIAIHLP